MRRTGFIGGVALLIMVLSAGAAFASATLDKASVPAATDVDLILEMSVEELVGYNERIVMAVPDGFQVLACTEPTGYKCTRTAATNPARTVVTWENITPSPQEFGITPTVRFPFRLRTISLSGDYKFDVDQFYSNGASSKWNGAKGSANPAPVLKVTGAAAPSGPNTTDPPSTEPSTDTTTPPSSSPSFDFGTETTIPFGDVTTATTLPVDTTPTTSGTTDTTIGGFAAAEVVSTGDGDGIKGAERTLLLALAVLAVGAASFSTFRSRSGV